MDTCKHDWFFVNGTDDLKCKRCGEVTGPRSYEQRVQDILEYDTTQLLVPTGQLSTYYFKPDYNISFHNNHNTSGAGKLVGKLDFNGPEMVFEGDAAESAKVFIDWIATAFKGRLEEERKAGRKEAEQISWGIDWGREGDRDCATIIKRLPDGTAEVIAVEYRP